MQSFNFRSTVPPIVVINVQIKIKQKFKKRKKREKNKNNVCERLIKNFAKICHQSNYYLCDVSALQRVSYFAVPVWAT